MIHQAFADNLSGNSDCGEQIAQLHHLLALVEAIAGQPSSSLNLLDESARISAAYQDASLAAQRRFDALAAETGALAAAGLNILIDASDGAHPPRAAALRLANELNKSLQNLGKLVRQ